MVLDLKNLFGEDPPEKAPEPLDATALDILRQRFDNEQAEQDLTAQEVWVRIGSEVTEEDRMKVEKLPAKTPVVHFYYPDDVPPRYITPELELLAKQVAQRDLSGEPFTLSEESLDQLAQYLTAKSGAKRVRRISGDRRWEWLQPLTVRHPDHNQELIMQSIRNLGHRIFQNEAPEFELSFEYLEDGPNGPDGYLNTVISAITEAAGQALRERRHARKVPHPDYTDVLPF